jgi:prepilin-type N-terminal cleavage/methylation domain-containing protein
MKWCALSHSECNFYNHKHRSGFTIIELMVVIVIIAILATVTFVSYLGITQKAAATVLKLDLNNASTGMALYKINNNSYPADLAAAQSENVLPSGNDTVYQYTLNGGDYCLSVTSVKAGNYAYHFSSLVGAIEDGVCSGHKAPGEAKLPSELNLEILVVAGGGAGQTASDRTGGGGGAGGVVYMSSKSISVGDAYPVVVGIGGSSSGQSGKNSYFGDIVAIGGGAGGSVAGGSGGGAKHGGAGAPSTQGSVVGGAIYGNSGGSGYDSRVVGSPFAGGGGGGATSVGLDGTTLAGGNGGAGLTSSISGSSISYAGGGGGGAENVPAGAGGIGGGGAGARNGAGIAGAANTGGGGGGGGTGGAGGAGGSGVVIIRYLTSSGITYSGGSVTYKDGYTIHTFTSSGNFICESGNVKIEALVVAGGAGGATNGGGGGGAGGLIYDDSMMIVKGKSYNISVGNGGVAGQNGENSSFNGYVAIGGGTGMWGIEKYGKPTEYSNAGEIFFVVTKDKIFFDISRHF